MRWSHRNRVAAIVLVVGAASCGVRAIEAKSPERDERATGTSGAGDTAIGATAAPDAGIASVGSTPSSAAAVVIAPSPPGTPATLIHRVAPSRLLPEVLSGRRGLVAVEDGARRMLLDRMRLFVRADGSLDRATELLPVGQVSSVALPSRLGGGYLFYVNQGRGTEMWRAEGWLDKLVPLTRLNEVVSEIVPGFDRLYLRLSSGNRVLAIDPKDGHPMGLGPLPVASGYGLLAFADGWRAVVDTDLRGPLTTFDAGATWRPVSVQERVLGVGIVDGNPTVLVNGGGYVIDARGGVTLRLDAAPRPRSTDDDDARGRDGADLRAASPLGKRPLRAAVEDGWPDTSSTAIVARGGALARVSLTDGRVLAVAEDAYPEHRSTCHAVRLGLHDIGFLCGEREGPTTVYAFAPPLAMKPVLRFDKPRYVAASGNGALVIRGRCAEDAEGEKNEADARWYCVRSPTGDMREIRVKGFDLGVERVVGLGDGRIAVLVPPRGATPGVLSIIAGASAQTVPLELPTNGAAHDLRSGLWLDGFEERRPGVLGGWVEAGGPSVGVEVGLDGKVKAGEAREDALGAIYGGRFAVSLGDGGRAYETSDGGMSWAELTLPERDEEARALPSRACGPVGCALPGWVRVGWGEPQDPSDMREAKAPTAPYPPIRMPPTLHFDCRVASVATVPPPDKPAVSSAPRSRGVAALVGPRAPSAAQHETTWARFRNVEAPALMPDDYGVDNGSGPNDGIGLRAYAWGKLGSDWSRGGRWIVRYDDRFDPAGGVRASALTASLWSQLAEATDGIGTNPYSTSWRGFIDPSGRSLLASVCSRAICSLYSVADGQPVLPLRGPNGTVMRPYDNAAVRVGEAWFFLTATPSYDGLQLWRAELGAARPIAAYPRVFQRNAYDQPRLVRRALGTGVGILVAGPAEPGEHTGAWFVLPIDLESGKLGEAISLGRRDFGGVSLRRCAPGQDGWTFDLLPTVDVNTNVELSNARARFDSVELRVRLDPGRACVDALAVRSEPFYALEAKGAPPGPARPLTAPPARAATSGTRDEDAIPMAATEKQSGRRWGLTCQIRR